MGNIQDNTLTTTVPVLTDEQCDALISELHDIGTECDKYCYGLPIGNMYSQEEMRNAVRTWFSSLFISNTKPTNTSIPTPTLTPTMNTYQKKKALDSTCLEVGDIVSAFKMGSFNKLYQVEIVRVTKNFAFTIDGKKFDRWMFSDRNVSRAAMTIKETQALGEWYLVDGAEQDYNKPKI